MPRAKSHGHGKGRRKGKTPFSGAAKKQQLQAKRARNRARAAANADDYGHTHGAGAGDDVGEAKRTVALDRHGRRNEFTTVFMRERDADVQYRRNQSVVPLARPSVGAHDGIGTVPGFRAVAGATCAGHAVHFLPVAHQPFGVDRLRVPFGAADLLAPGGAVRRDAPCASTSGSADEHAGATLGAGAGTSMNTGAGGGAGAGGGVGAGTTSGVGGDDGDDIALASATRACHLDSEHDSSGGDGDSADDASLGSGDDSGDDAGDGSGTKTAVAVQSAEAASFELWIAELYSHYPRWQLNHFEHNIEVWRQLWHVLLDADVVALLADVRNPLYHVHPALCQHVLQRLRKRLVIVLTKVHVATLGGLRFTAHVHVHVCVCAGMCCMA